MFGLFLTETQNYDLIREKNLPQSVKTIKIYTGLHIFKTGVQKKKKCMQNFKICTNI